MVLTAENYYSQKANEEYMSVSQFKDFCGTYGKMPCEFTAMEKLKGRWEEPKSKALMVGSYVDSYFEGTLYTFKKKNPDLFKRDGSLKAEFVKADEIIQRIERDSYFMFEDKQCAAGEVKLTDSLYRNRSHPYTPGESKKGSRRFDRTGRVNEKAGMSAEFNGCSGRRTAWRVLCVDRKPPAWSIKVGRPGRIAMQDR